MTRTQIARRVRYYVKKANKIWGLQVPNPQISYFTRGNTAGRAYCYEHRLEFNERLATLNPTKFTPIVIHEVAHLITFQLFPDLKRHHPHQFMAIDLALGGGGFVHHNLVLHPPIENHLPADS
jgi:predicted SprT family Zn-dependent metalloprotease